MSPEMLELAKRLETRTRQLMLQHNKLRGELEEARTQILEQKEYIQALEDENKELQDKYLHLKMAKLIDMADDGDMRQVRQRINRMLKSVDHCISIMKVND